MELLPAQRDIQIRRRRGALSERSLGAHEGAIIACAEKDAASYLARLPAGEVWQRLYKDARRLGPVRTLGARLTPSAIPVVVVFVKPTMTAYERLAAAARAWKELQLPAEARVALVAHELGEPHGSEVLEALLAAGLAATAPLPSFKSKATRQPRLKALTLIGAHASLDTARTAALDRGNHLARWLTMLPPNVLDSRAYKRALQSLARRHRWGFTFLNEAALRRAGAGAFLAVAQANEHRGAGIARLRYRTPTARKRSRLALIGKGVCFDTGGINLKTHKGMYQMHEDMQGSAVAVGTLLALSEMRVPYDIDCWLAITENQIGARAYRPQEVVRAANGVTIQVAHSDAEGRMVLADGLALAAREKPGLIIDYATLTGACVGALTERFSGAFTNRPALHERIESAGRSSGERVWPFPMDDDFDSDLESPIADILQCTPDSKGDHILAARFLNRFVPQQIPWIHLDLSASNRAGGLAHIPTEFTGFGVRFTAQLLEDHALLSGKPTLGETTAKLRQVR